jgi:hypothetical protein
MSVSNAPQIERIVAQFVHKMNQIGLTPLVDINDKHAFVAFSFKEFITAMKNTLLKAGIPEDKLTVEVVPFQGDKYIRILVKKQ